MFHSSIRWLLAESRKAAGIGNVADADFQMWPRSIKEAQVAFPDLQSVIPGHGPIGKRPVQRTLELLK
jgi:hypothetical protein